MRNLVALFVLVFFPAIAQDEPVRRASAQSAPTGAAFVRENYSKYEYRIAMPDGVKLFTSVYVPKDVITDGKTYSIMMTRIPYNVRPYGADQYRDNLGTSLLLARATLRFVYQAVRGRLIRVATYSVIRPH